MPEVERLFEYWRQSPPTHEMVAAYLGYKPPIKASEITDREVMELAQLFGAPGKPTTYTQEMVQWAEQMKAKIGRA